ncbi:acetyl-CoA carboxylase biotin carboxyl carrier protein subunit [Staphylococcus felis]|uniref:acetyl-CoA carboxylase biotin carboxyl carrier protein n=1 Tax=Staphylococcus felis TaxID=46127 RepID=UPI000CD057E8|nr:biotin/lipoyl-containing protein [Staphylococcus felis]AVP37204.1 acetyl-CoA carboxylase biotin carboxyl carrier protein subunit [Staphylococcus felis]PNZ34443.1 acetyl-CoA carboxylase biotin carboxyl carrier protein subunit [Staphylococcus felis]QQB02849.1 acetyl-CoA carboxylase biotin carboxyl carrier protein subunit [Staphylococcus felis]REH76118.1 acetyl-CoA carboxylase biotin carboxyl carrier protein subunit [Staphylococcus felis]REH94157.1 acetyl-CoA carboxylase biotin carboxyl carrie
MDLKQIEQTLNLLKSYGAKHFRYSDDEMELELDLPASQSTYTNDEVNVNTTQSQNNEIVTNQSSEQNEAYTEVRSQMIGTFYLQDEKELTKPVIKVGDKINKGDIIGYVEAMKVMNEVKSDEAGEIVEILVDHGENVEHNQIILRLK